MPVKDSNDTAGRPEGKLPPGQPGTDEQVSAGAGDKSEDESSEASLDVPALLPSTCMASSEAGLRFVCPAGHVLRQQVVLLMEMSEPLLCPAGHKPASSSAAAMPVLGKAPTCQAAHLGAEGATPELTRACPIQHTQGYLA